jgi:hypothetical protein
VILCRVISIILVGVNLHQIFKIELFLTRN